MYLWWILCLIPFILAQQPDVPSEFLDPRRRMQGDNIVFCIDSSSVTAGFDRAAAAEIASALLLEATFFEVDYSDVGIEGAEGFFYLLFIDLTNNCDAFMGLNLAVSGYPDWLTVSRPYAKVPYVLAVMNESYDSLTDIPRDNAIGSQLASTGDVQFITYLQTLSADNRWRRLPYADSELMIQRLLDGTLAGALIWAPVLSRIADGGNPAASGIHIISAEPLKNLDVDLGIVLLSQNAFLRTQLDEAIVALTEDGVIERLLEEHNILGHSGELGR